MRLRYSHLDEHIPIINTIYIPDRLKILEIFPQPIPYWLYKLHGLNISYTCEICGNYTYKGPKAFQRHFAEWRHAHGMRCLGIPNTAHFANVTQIEDALACKCTGISRSTGMWYKKYHRTNFLLT